MKFVALLFLAASALFADGGPVLLHQPSGPFLITVFGTPQAGPTDLSVLVQNASNGTPILDAAVQLHLDEATVPATHDQAANKLLYAALVNFPHRRKCRLEINVTQNGSTATTAAAIDIVPAPGPMLTFWPYFALVPAAILLFAFNQYLKARRLKRPPAPP